MMIYKILKLMMSLALMSSLAGCSLPPPPPKVQQPESMETTLACTDYANIRGGPSGSPYTWRFYLAFNGSTVAGCFEVRRIDNRKINWRTQVPCQVMGTRDLLTQAQLQIPIERPEMPSAAGPLTYTLLQPGEYIECDFNLNQFLQAAWASGADLGITMTQPVYTYTYFSMSALTYLSPTQVYTGLMLALEPQQCSEAANPACQPSTWSVRTGAPNTIQFETRFNGEAVPFVTPGEFPYTTTLMQGWWVGLRTQFDTLTPMADTLKLEHLHDQAHAVDDIGVQFKHQTTTYGYKTFISDEEDQRFKFWGGPTKIYIGGQLGQPQATFNGGLIQIMVDPSGGSAPDGGI
jgi:hypothetical protein